MSRLLIKICKRLPLTIVRRPQVVVVTASRKWNLYGSSFHLDDRAIACLGLATTHSRRHRSRVSIVAAVKTA